MINNYKSSKSFYKSIISFIKTLERAIEIFEEKFNKKDIYGRQMLEEVNNQKIIVTNILANHIYKPKLYKSNIDTLVHESYLINENRNILIKKRQMEIDK